MLIDSITTLKTITGGAVGATMEFESIEPFFQIAHEMHLEFWLGTDLLESLETELASNDPDATAVALAPYYRRALGWLTVYEYLSFASVQLGESGLHRVETESHKTAYKYQEKAVRETCLNNGYEALEKLLIYYEGRKTDFPGWPIAPGYEIYHGQLLNTVTAWRMVQAKKMTRQVFETMVGIAKEVEEMAIVPIIGQAQYDALLAHRRDDDYTSEALEKKIILMAQRIAAHFTLTNALRQHLVELRGDRVVQLEFLEDQGVPKEGSPTIAAVGIKLDSHDQTANTYINKLRALLEANLEDDALTDYVAWKATLAEAEEAYQDARSTDVACAVSINDERCDGGNAHGFGVFSTVTRKGASRL